MENNLDHKNKDLNRNKKYRTLKKINKNTCMLKIKISTCKCMVCPGEKLPYYINITNECPYPVTNITVLDILQDGLEIDSFKMSSGTMDNVENKIIWKIKKIEVGEKVIAVIVVVPMKDAFNDKNKYIINKVELICDNKFKKIKNSRDVVITYVDTYNNSIIQQDYYSHNDIYNYESSKTLTILPHFKTYQQTTEYTCGPACSLMVLEHFGEYEYNESEIAKVMDTDKVTGTPVKNMVKFFKNLGWEVSSNITHAKLDGGYTFDSPLDFKKWVIENLKNNKPIMVAWSDWDGHWQIIIGYDTITSNNDNENMSDDVLIFADPYDTTDHVKDGYYIYPAARFYYMWFVDDKLLENERNQPWIIANPKI